MVQIVDEEAVKQLMQENGWTYGYAKEQYLCMTGDTPFYRGLKAIMEETGCNYSSAKYIYYKRKKGEEYKTHAKHFEAVTYEEVKDIDIPSNILNFRARGSYRGLYIFWNGKYISLATVVYLQANKCDKPEGYLINHKNGDVYNNTLENLEMIEAEKNTMLANKKVIANQVMKMPVEDYIALKAAEDAVKEEKRVQQALRQQEKLQYATASAMFHEVVERERQLKKQRAECRGDIAKWRLLGSELKQVAKEKEAARKTLQSFKKQ